MRLNNINSNIISVGSQLFIPINSSDIDYINYVVVSGDTLYSISRKFDVSVSDIKTLNNLNSNNLSIGMSLKIPVVVNPGIGDYSTYVVKNGDTLYSISRMFNISVDEIKEINNLIGNTLFIGQVLRVIDNSFDNNLDGMSCYGDNYVEVEYVLYTVKRGDSLYIISRRFNVSIDSLRKLNNLTSDNLNIGQVLKIKEVN